MRQHQLDNQSEHHRRAELKSDKAMHRGQNLVGCSGDSIVLLVATCAKSIFKRFRFRRNFETYLLAVQIGFDSHAFRQGV